ncbi:MAG: undecaprenyl phosphate translocase family protein, partial [Candidatus Woesearchaeota archaeon]
MKEWLIVFIKGILMGICDIIPGISGGTIAFITGIYQRL